MKRVPSAVPVFVSLAGVAALAALAAQAPVARAAADSVDRAMFGNTFVRNMVSAETGLPAEWDVKTGKNVKWWSDVGSQAYAGPVVLAGRVFVGTNNDGLKNPKLTKDRGVVMAFAAKDGQFLWQSTHEKLPAGRVNDWPQQGICSTPFVEGNRIYYTSNRATITCLDTEGFRDGGENDGAQDEKEKSEIDADVVWEFDLMKELDVFPHNLAVSSPLVVDGVLYATTGNGVDEGHVNIPSPKAPSFIALDAKTGELLWENNLPGAKIFHGTWSNPTYGVVKGRAQVIFPGGDGWIYSFEPKKGALLWKFNANPPGAKYILGGRGTANEVIGTAVLYEDRLYFGVGQDPEHGEGVGNFWCIDASLEGDITGKEIWHRGGNDFRRTISTVAIQDGIVYASDLSGFLYALDAKTGQHYWTHDMLAAVWGSPFVADGRVYLGDEDGDVEILRAGKTKQVLGTYNMGVSVYSTPVAKEGVLYVLARNRLFALQQGATGKPATPRQMEHVQ